MQPLNHDMDELFRKAAEDYPLKLGNGDWDNLAGKLLTGSATATSKNIKKNKRRKFTLFLLLLSFLLLSAGWLFLNQGTFQKKNIKDNDITSFKTVDQLSDTTTGQYRHQAGKHQLAADYKEKTHITENDQYDHKKLLQLNKQNKHVEERSAGEIRSADFNSLAHLPSPGNNYRIAVNDFQLKESMSSSFQKLNGLFNESPDPADSTRERNNPVIKKQKGLYVGLTGGPDFSEVRSQGITKAGYNVGLIAGYRLNKKWSVESGVIWSKKKYYSTGKYFSMSKIGPTMPAGMEVMEVEGQSSLFEFPVKVKYDFRAKQKSNLFLTAGISTTVYVKEKNNYLTKMNGVQEWQVGLYDNLPCSWFSLATISAGYEFAPGKYSSIRVEPYIKLPLKKVGMGSMPVFSTGINVTVTGLLGRP